VQLKISQLDAEPERDYSQTGRYYGATEGGGCRDPDI